MNSIKVSYVNLGVRENRETGEVIPNFPKNNTSLVVDDFERVFKNQINLDPTHEKGLDGMIFPIDLDRLLSIEVMSENGIEGNGLVFLDIDLNEDLDLRDRIFKSLEDINHIVGGWILAGCKTGHGLHIVGLGERMTPEVYHEASLNALAMFARAVEVKLDVDLRDYKNSLDTHNSCMKQRFFLRHSDEVYWNDDVVMSLFRIDSREYVLAVKDYPMIYKDGFNRAKNTGRLTFQDKGEIRRINHKITSVDYIEHTERWSLFDSICCCYDNEEDIMNQWYRCCELIPTTKHSVEFFRGEPKKNHWYRRFIDDMSAGKSKMINAKLMSKFGFEISSIKGDLSRESVERINNLNIPW